MSPVDAYIARFPADVRALLESMRRTIRAAARGATETISYGIPTFDLHGKHLVHYAAFKHHIGFYPTGRGMQDFATELAKYPTGRGSVQFAFDAPLPLALVRRIVRQRVAVVTAEAKTAAPRKRARTGSAAKKKTTRKTTAKKRATKRR